jgi:MFS family permease
MQSFLTKIYLYRFLDAFKLIGVIFALYFSNSGLNPFQISLLLAIWSITTIVTEVPMGVLADKYSRRNLLIVGLVLLAIGFCFWLRGGFINFAIGFVFWGLKNTLTSGTLEAFVYDELAAFGKEDQYEKVSGKMGAAFSFGLVLSAIFGGLVAEISFTWVIIASIATTLLAGVVLLTIRQVKAVQSTGESNYFQFVKEAVFQIKGNPALLIVILFICLVFASFGATDEFWALIYQKLGFSAGVIGFLVAFVYGLSTLAGTTVHYFKNSIKNLSYLLVLVGGLLFILFGLTKLVILLPVVFIAIYLLQVASIKLEAEMQSHIKSSQRATIASIKSLIFEFVYMGFVLSFGVIGNKSSVISILTFTGSIILLTTILFLFIEKKSPTLQKQVED